MRALCAICEAETGGPVLCGACAGLLRWVRSYFAHDPGLSAKIVPETRFVEDLGVESLDWMCWPLEAKEKLGVALGDEQLERIRTVGQFVRALRDAGALWPDGSDVRLRQRRHWWSPYRWEIARAGEGGPSGQEIG
jgi:acyl carrier protein